VAAVTLKQKLWLGLLSPLWLPRWFFGWALWKLRKRTTLHVVLRGSLPDLSSAPGLLGLLRPPTGPDLLPLLEALGRAARLFAPIALGARTTLARTCLTLATFIDGPPSLAQ